MKTMYTVSIYNPYDLMSNSVDSFDDYNKAKECFDSEYKKLAEGKTPHSKLEYTPTDKELYSGSWYVEIIKETHENEEPEITYIEESEHLFE